MFTNVIALFTMRSSNNIIRRSLRRWFLLHNNSCVVKKLIGFVLFYYILYSVRSPQYFIVSTAVADTCCDLRKRLFFIASTREMHDYKIDTMNSLAVLYITYVMF